MEKEQKTNIFENPTKQMVILIITICIISNGLLILAFTDLFTTNFTTTAAITSLMSGSVIATAKLVGNYLKNNQKEENEN